MTTTRFFAISALLAVATSAAMADTLSYSSVVPTTTPPFIDTFTLSNFDTSLGTLTAVNVTFDYSISGTVTLYNVMVVSDLSINNPLTLSVTGLSETVIANTTPLTGQCSTNCIVTGAGTESITVPNADFSDFEVPPSGSTDTYSVTAGMANLSIGTLGSNASASIRTVTDGGTVAVTYTYTPSVLSTTPEATSAILLSSALLVAFLVRKRNARGRSPVTQANR